jgi:hypothetical protein
MGWLPTGSWTKALRLRVTLPQIHKPPSLPAGSVQEVTEAAPLKTAMASSVIGQQMVYFIEVESRSYGS